MADDTHEYRIRAARDEDLSKLADVENRAGELFASTRHAFLRDGPTLSPKIIADQYAQGAVWVAVDGRDEPIGFAVAGRLGDEAYLYEIDVEPEHGRRGLGRMLVHAAESWARESGYPTLTLSTFADVEWNAPFYARLGYEVVPESELTPAMVDTRLHEAEAGFLMDVRVFMRRTL